MSGERVRGSDVHPIVRLNFLTRLVACPLVATVVLSARWTGGDATPASLWAAFAFYALAWPHVVYAGSRRTGDAAREQHLLLVDAAIIGAAVAIVSFRPVPAICLLIPVTTFGASIGGLSFMARAIGTLVASALVTGVLVTGFDVPETAVTAQLLAATGLTTFQAMMGLFTFRTARAFVESRRQLSRQAEEIRRQNVELVVARESALEAAKAKSAFLATMSHEIRTPLNGVLGMARLLAETPLSAEQQDLLRTVRSSGDTLVTVINDILDFSRVESGRLELEQEPLDVVSVVEDALEIVSDSARRRGIELVCEIVGDPPATVLGDATRLRQVMTNLAGNAVKFTERGEVVVAVHQRQTGGAGEPAGIAISVRDSGIGIPADRIPLLFSAFSQADTSTTRRYGGTGLGLAISQRLVGLMGGEICVESEPGKGSTFSFTLRAPVAPVQARPSPPVPESTVRVLVVDDNATNRRALCGQLRLWGMQAVDADGAEPAVAALAGDGPFDLAILDYHMPGVDGMELARRIRSTPEGTALPMVLLSSSLVLARDDAEGLFTSRLLKPARQSSLFDAIGAALGARTPGGNEAVSRQAGPVGRGLRILVADDNDVNRNIAQLVLRRFGAEADEVADGREAVDRVEQAAGGSGAYDLVFMDVQMPVMDGLEAAIEIRRLQAARPSQRWPRIVAMTANAMHEDRAKCLGAGMDDYLTKPLVFEEVGRVLGHAATTVRGAASADAGPTWPDAQVLVDWSRLEELAEYDTPEGTVVRGAIASLAGQAPQSLEEIRRSIASGESTALHAAAHRLKGAASNLGAVALSDLASRLESAAKDGMLEGVERLAEDLAEVLQATLRRLDDHAQGLRAQRPENA